MRWIAILSAAVFAQIAAQGPPPASDVAPLEGEVLRVAATQPIETAPEPRRGIRPSEAIAVDGEATLVPVHAGARRRSPADIVAEALALPEGGSLTGRPLTLLEALSSARDTGQRLEVTHAYWRLTMAVAEYRLGFERYEQLRKIDAHAQDGSILRTAQASAARSLEMAESAAHAAQRELARAAVLPATEPSPLPADLPYLGTYRTHFDEVFSQRNPPIQTWLIDRKLPIRRRAIEARASAVGAAQDALGAAVDAYRLGSAGLHDVLRSLGQLEAQRRALLASACDYNHDIADYALSVAGPKSDARSLVAMLIGANREAAPPLISRRHPGAASPRSGIGRPSGPSSGVRPATMNAAVPGSGARRPTPAPPRGQLKPLGTKTPTLAPPRESVEPSDPRDPSSAPQSGPSEGPVVERPAQAPTSDGSATAQPKVLNQPLVPVPDGLSTSTSRTANRPVIDSHGGLQSTPGLYPALVDAEPAARTKHLTAALSWHRTLPEHVGELIELNQCLTGPPAARRRQVIAAYWLTAQRAAEYQVLVAEVDFLEQLAPVALESSGKPSGAQAMLRIRAAKSAAQADLLGAELDLLDAQFQLAQRVGRLRESLWPLPATAPYSGPCPSTLGALPGGSAGPWPLRRSAALLPAWAESLQERAAAVVEADAARAAATAAYQAGTQPIDRVLASIRRQTEETLAFLDTLTKYNDAVADYALAVLPSNVPGAQLAEMLVERP